MKTTYKVTIKNEAGEMETIKRTTDRIYTHVVTGIFVRYGSGETATPKLIVLGWCGRPDLANKLAASSRASSHYTDVTIHPCAPR